MATSQSTVRTIEAVRSMEPKALHQDRTGENVDKVSASRESIIKVLQDFLTEKKYNDGLLSVKGGFLFVFNDERFSSWHTLSWWEQRRLILEWKDDPGYREQVDALLSKSNLALYIHYSDKEVAKSTEQAVKQAWMRKRLVLKECFWNVLDSVSCAAYFQKKYQDQFPALCVLLCNTADDKGQQIELVLGIDNGIGYVYKKKSRESILIRFLYKTYKFIFRKGVFYIGGLELGLMETDSELSCHGSGAVVYQGWQS
jgi:hypothetical protein